MVGLGIKYNTYIFKFFITEALLKMFIQMGNSRFQSVGDDDDEEKKLKQKQQQQLLCRLSASLLLASWQ